jgi:aldehyde dehydrogenase (NAD+)
MSEFTMTIDGKAVAGENSFGVINPATEEVFAECPECTQAQLNSAMEAAKRTFQSWRTEDIAKRKQVLLDCAAALKPHVEELADEEQFGPAPR